MNRSVTIETEDGVALPGELASGAPPEGEVAGGEGARGEAAGGEPGAAGRARGGIVVFAHGSGSSRHSPRNQAVARSLREAGIATLLFDLLTSEEEAADARTGELRFDVGLLAARVRAAIDQLAGPWPVQGEPTSNEPAGSEPTGTDSAGADSAGSGAAELGDTRGRPIGLFGASTGAAGALLAAEQRPDVVRAVVSRGGRPDLAGDRLPHVRTPTLLIVGGADPQVLDFNRRAQRRMDPETEVELQVVPGAGHLFDAPGELEQVARLAVRWFGDRLG